MPRVPTTHFPFLLAAALATAFMPDRATHAGVILAVDDPQHNGVMVWDGTPEDFAPASDSPAHAIAGNGRSSLRLLGSQMALSFVEISVSILNLTFFLGHRDAAGVQCVFRSAGRGGQRSSGKSRIT